MPLPDHAAAMPPTTGLRRFLSPRRGRAAISPHDLPAGFFAAAAAVAAAALLGRLVTGISPLPNLAMIFVPAILYAALHHGFLSALFASVLSVLAFNFFFMEPVGAFGIRGIDDALALAVFLAIGAITSDLASQVRGQAAAAREREAHTAALYELKHAVDRANSPDEVAQTALRQIARRLGVSAAFWERTTSGEWKLLAATDSAVAREVARPQDVTNAQIATVGAALQVPIVAADATAGLIVVMPAAIADNSASLAMLQALANEAGDAIRHARLQEELETARRIAETGRLRAALLNSITHDFRTPLASILGATTTLMVPGPSFTSRARQMMLSTIRDEALRLDRFIRNLLDMSRLEAGAVVPNFDWVEVVDVVGAAVQHMRRMRTNLALEITLPDDLPMLRLDAVLIEHALVNLLDNALKHTPPDGRIRVSARRTDRSVLVEVDDEGPGVPSAERDIIFDKFTRAQGGDRGRAGIGLGLSIARGFVEAQGGSLRVADRPGGGARFVIELPIVEEVSGS